MKEQRREIIIMLARTTAAVLLAVGLFALVLFAGPRLRDRRLQTSLESGDTETARRIIRRLKDSDQPDLLQQCSYLDGERLAEGALWQEASAAFRDAGGYGDAVERRKDCDFRYALQLEQNGDWDAAETIFLELEDDNGAADHVRSCRYGKAVELLRSGDSAEGARILEKLGDYRDSASLFLRTVQELTGIDEEQRAVAAFHGMTEADLELIGQLEERRASLPGPVLDMGYYHTVGLLDDGTVSACGDNSCGQCDTREWTGVTAVSAGAYHTAALRRDGTVVCAGRNSEGQCGTEAWQNIIQIAAADWATYGLRDDGTVVCCGFLSYKTLETWTDVVSITAGSYGIAARLKDGTFRFCPEREDARLFDNAECFALNSGFAVGAQKNGIPVCSVGGTEDWNGIISLSCSSTAILGLRADGRISSCFFRPQDTVDLSSVTDAAAVCAGAVRFAVVHADGSVSLFGSLSPGEEEAETWTLLM